MKSIELKVSLRTTTGKKDAKKLRKNNQVPCVLYGGKENKHFFAEERSFKDLIYTHHVYIVNLDIEGKKHKAILKEIQFHPVSDRIDHIDFVEVAADNPVVIDLPVEITGSSVGIRAGGKLRQRKRYVKVKGLVEHLPDSLVIDISDLEIGQSVLAGDLKYPHVEILELKRSLIVGVVSSRIAKGMEEGAEAAAPAEGAPAAAAPTAETAAPVETKKK
ncbi:MAG: 50S ribosomal protein L25 [Bacteroidales bacterium]|nr:50S ribosomal protein L25 [Bacteroidales bacterium]